MKYQEKSCGVVIFREENGEKKFLILHYPGGHFDFPKGHVEEKDENEIKTTLRELHEETGIQDVDFIEGYREEIFYKPHKDNEDVKLVVYRLGKTSEKEVKISHEHTGWEWMDYDSAFNKLTYENAKNLLRKAKEFLNQARS